MTRLMRNGLLRTAVVAASVWMAVGCGEESGGEPPPGPQSEEQRCRESQRAYLARTVPDAERQGVSATVDALLSSPERLGGMPFCGSGR